MVTRFKDLAIGAKFKTDLTERVWRKKITNKSAERLDHGREVQYIPAQGQEVIPEKVPARCNECGDFGRTGTERDRGQTCPWCSCGIIGGEPKEKQFSSVEQITAEHLERFPQLKKSDIGKYCSGFLGMLTVFNSKEQAETFNNLF